jgi:cytochrome c oxidase accessory protein FixG
VYATALLGRAWCGWACPQTVFLEGVYRRVERLIEGPRESRLKTATGSRSLVRGLRTIAKHVAFIVISIGVAHNVLSYFVSIPRAWAMVHDKPTAHPEAFAWVTGVTLLLYGNFAWFREQMCLILCPYGRLQSVLIDDDSLVVGYDTKRGEPRGKKGKTTGDCVDCNRCVVVCPTGIDIRNGLQLDCVACTACIDACDDVMGRLGRERGLIRYDSQNGLAGKPKRIARPRLYLYTAMLVVGAVVAGFAARSRTDFEMNVLRPKGAPYVVENGRITNTFEIHLVNKRGESSAFDVYVDGPSELVPIVPVPHVTVDSLRDARVPVVLTMTTDKYYGDIHPQVRVVRAGSNPPDQVVKTVTFLGARK